MHTPWHFILFFSFLFWDVTTVSCIVYSTFLLAVVNQLSWLGQLHSFPPAVPAVFWRWATVAPGAHHTWDKMKGQKGVLSVAQTLQLQRVPRQDELAWACPARSASGYERKVQNIAVFLICQTGNTKSKLQIWELVSSQYMNLIHQWEIQVPHIGCKHLAREVISTEQQLVIKHSISCCVIIKAYQ